MLYDTYRQRIQHLAERLRTILRIAVPCLILLFTAVILTAAVEFCRGLFLSGLTDQKIVYGEAVQTDANAFLCPVQYETQIGDSSWQPLDMLTAGEYQLRGFSENRFGIRRYTDTVHVTVTPRALFVTVSAHTWDYGAPLPYTWEDLHIEGLVNGDRLAIAEFLADSALPGTVSVTLDRDSLRIENEYAADVTACYRVTVEEGVGTIEASLTVSAYSAVKVFDGTPLSLPQYYISEGQLPSAHRLQVTVEGSVTETGQTENRIVGHSITDEAGTDVSQFYRIIAKHGMLRILPCPVEISTGSTSEIFDGKSLSCADYWISGGALPAGYRMEVEMPTTLTYPGVAVNRCGQVKIYAVIGGKTVDMTHNFEITEGAVGMLRLY